jgi:flagella basal body P-ring formation protein FlgA
MNIENKNMIKLDGKNRGNMGERQFCRLLLQLPVLVFLLLFSSDLWAGSESMGLVKSAVNQFYFDRFQKEADKISIKFMRFPQRLGKIKADDELIIRSNFGVDKLGYQTIWIHQYRNDKFETKFPVSVELKLRQKALIALKRIRRGEKISQDNCKIEEVLIDKSMHTFAEPNLNAHMETNRMINSGSVILKRMLREPPLLRRGEKIRVQIENSGFCITTVGKLKEDGILNEVVTVECEPYKKQMKGVLKNQNLVVVKTGDSL